MKDEITFLRKKSETDKMFGIALEEQIALNQFGQSLRTKDDLLSRFSGLTLEGKRLFLFQFTGMIQQSKPIDADVELAIEESRLKPTYTPCVLLRVHRLKIGIPKVIALPGDELNKAYVLLMYIFRRAYLRRYLAEMGSPHKWWYADLSDEAFVNSLLRPDSKDMC
jgi:hypothetical protein